MAFSFLFQFSRCFVFSLWRSEVCGCLTLNRAVGGGGAGGCVFWWGWFWVCFFFKAELFLYVWAQFPIEGTADFSSKMGLGKVSQRK